MSKIKKLIKHPISYTYKRLERRWHVRYKFNIKHLYMDIIIMLVIFALIGLNLFWWIGGSRYFFNKLELEVVANFEQVTNGQDVNFQINYNNKNEYRLEDAVLSIKFPKHFKLKNISQSDYNQQDNTLLLGDLLPGANSQINVTGQVIGELDEKQNIIVSLSYFKTDKRDKRLWGQFQTNSVLSYEINDSYLQIESSALDKVVNNQVIDWRVLLKNTSSNINFEKAVVIPNYDEQNIIMVEPVELEITNLGPGQSKEFIIKTKINTELGKIELKADAYWQTNEFNFLQSKWNKDLEVIYPKFELSQSQKPDKAVTPGDWVEFEINYKNQGKYSIENAEIGFELIGDYWDLAQMEKQAGRIENNIVYWTANEVEHLNLIQPGESGQIKLKVKTKQYSYSSQSALSSRLFVKYRLEGNDVEIENNQVDILLNTNLSLQAYPRYFARTGDQLGRGPIPAQVGQETKYWVFVKLTNDINDVENAVVTARLADNVKWTDRSNVPIGNAVQYSSLDKSIFWSISRVPQGAQNFGFAFEVGITPSQNQVGTYPVLLSNIKISGTDTVTGQSIEKAISNVTTSLNWDERGKLQDGVVQ